jgi:conjugative transfer region protein TrbK
LRLRNTLKEIDMNPARILAIAILGIAAVGAARVVAQQLAGDVRQASSVDPLAKELERCRQLNEKAENDQACQAAYAENRKRFFTPPAPYVPGKVDLFPNQQPLTTDRKPAPATTEK